MYSIKHGSYKATRTAYRASYTAYNILALIYYQNTNTGHFNANTEGITRYIYYG